MTTLLLLSHPDDSALSSHLSKAIFSLCPLCHANALIKLSTALKLSPQLFLVSSCCSWVLMATLPTFFAMFSFMYLLAYFVVFRNWGPKHRAGASSCFISLVHGTPAVVIASFALLNTQTTLPTALLSSNTNSQNIVLEYSIAYFLMDLLHYIIFIPSDVLFILHHVVTLYVFATFRYMVHHGAFAILALLILAEITSPCQNVWSIAAFQKADVPASAKLYEILSPPFYAFYSVVRGVMAPLFVYKMWVFYQSEAADNFVPKWAWFSWMFVIISGIVLSILWVLNNWIDWYRERSNRTSKKVS